MQKFDDPSSNEVKIRIMMHKILSQLLSDEPIIGYNAMLALVVGSAIEENVSEDEFIEDIKKAYKHFKKLFDESKPST